MNGQALKVLYVSAEVAPFAKTGGLADVAGSLPRALAALGVDVRVVMPRHKSIPQGPYVCDYPVKIDNRTETAVVREGKIDKLSTPGGRPVPVYFIDNYQYFSRDEVYGYADDGERWAFFCRAFLALTDKIKFYPDVIHLNDWQCGPAAVMLKKEYRRSAFYRHTASLITIHNLEYQGHFGRDMLPFMGLSDDLFHPNAMEFFGRVNFLKGGLLFADLINTVSRTYAKEIQTAEHGWGLEGVLRNRRDDLFGIVNGIDDEHFNPSTDPYIEHHYSAKDIEPKKKDKENLQREFHLPVKDVPLFGLVSRLVDQKGLNLFNEIGEELLKEDLQLVVVGQGDPRYENMFRSFHQKYPEKVGLYTGFNAPLAQRVYAGSDFFLMPSRFEPCGLGQLISFRYGTIPIVRATGGLADTVIDIDQPIGSGFVFEEYDPEKLLEAIRRALRHYREKEAHRQLVKQVMELDFSWHHSAQEYMNLYEKAIQKVSIAHSL
ncbi:glycogen synthase GlgA [Heliobacillus mobilis]|uniref:Glycogen synthase n=1 Tax=Heliobacterium mobile TaxID=28064 RepID=A0A6I3SKX9_HELMO|nr:glycogen synthase GlgA [Heliobacterium mobile]MTV49157.1 glycogen synthase GlgA [Heliobacterium mobile]